MKSSLIWRFVLVAVILGTWILSMFPLRDRPFLPMFRELAEPQIEEIRENKRAAAEEAEELKDRLAELENEKSSQYKELKQEYETKRETVAEHKEKLKKFENVIQRAQELLEKNEKMAPYVAVRKAAGKTSDHASVSLAEYFPGPEDRSNRQVLSFVRNKASGKLKLGLDLRGGTEFVIGFQESEIPEDRNVKDVRDQIQTILRNRVDSMGLVRPQIKAIGPTTISLRVPAVSASERADIRQAITQPAKLRFHVVHEENQKLVQKFKENPQEFEPPIGYAYYEMKQQARRGEEGQKGPKGLFLKKRAEGITGEEVKNAKASFGRFGSYTVSLEFNNEGAKEFANVTEEYENRRLAIVLDEKVYSAPVIQEAIAGGQAQITGDFTARQAQKLAAVIQSGNLPVGIQIDSEFGTDPTLGKDSIRSGATAAIAGLVLVMLFMLVYYRVAGAVAISALLANIVLVFGTLTLSGATITLPGIAGIVLTIGMAVDANVLIFERIREEKKSGKTLGNALQAGYSRAFLTIFDANLTTLLTALILFQFGTGPIQGFAVTLSVGIVASMFTALFMTRVIFDGLLYIGWMTKMSMGQLFEKPDLPFLNFRKLAAVLSGALILLTIVVVGVRGESVLSIDFSGGTSVLLRSTEGQAPGVGEIRDLMQKKGFSNVQIGYKQGMGQERRMLEIVMPSGGQQPEDFESSDVQTILGNAFAGANFEQARVNQVGGLVGERFRNKAIVAALLAAIIIILYISFRFEFAYGVAAVAALVHDIAIALGIYLLCGRQISLPVVAALLTIMGYSLNDTIVVFDRIREDLALLEEKAYVSIINLSINQVLQRTVLTSVTTLMVVVILFLFGGGAINDFALVLLIGIAIGTYSSIFVASNIIASWHKPAQETIKGVTSRGAKSTSKEPAVAGGGDRS